MSLTGDARLVVDSELGPHKFNHIATVSADSWKAAVRLATAYIEAGTVNGDGCPWCGASMRIEDMPMLFACGTRKTIGIAVTHVQSEKCKDRQIANMAARLATASEKLDRAVQLVSTLMLAADEYWQGTAHGVSVMESARKLVAERKAGGE